MNCTWTLPQESQPPASNEVQNISLAKWLFSVVKVQVVSKIRLLTMTGLQSATKPKSQLSFQKEQSNKAPEWIIEPFFLIKMKWFSKYLFMETYYMPSTLLGAAEVGEQVKAPVFTELTF